MEHYPSTSGLAGPLIAHYRGLIFDMDGTLVDNMEVHRQTWYDWALAEGLGLPRDQVLSQTHGTLAEIVGRFFPEASEEERLERGFRKEELYREVYGPQLAPMPGLLALLAAAHKAGLPMALATAGDRTNVAFVLDGLHLRGYFGAVVSAEQVRRGKPDPEVFLLAAKALGLAPADCLVFEDSPEGTEAARRAGMACVIVCPSAPPGRYGDTSHVVAFMEDYEGVRVDS